MSKSPMRLFPINSATKKMFPSTAYLFIFGFERGNCLGPVDRVAPHLEV